MAVTRNVADQLQRSHHLPYCTCTSDIRTTFMYSANVCALLVGSLCARVRACVRTVCMHLQMAVKSRHDVFGSTTSRRGPFVVSRNQVLWLAA